jgi:hypothetical protein
VPVAASQAVITSVSIPGVSSWQTVAATTATGATTATTVPAVAVWTVPDLAFGASATGPDVIGYGDTVADVILGTDAGATDEVLIGHGDELEPPILGRFGGQ